MSLAGAESYDVVVAGAGPSGSTTAQRLAARGVKVALVDKAKFPREKACGGGVQAKLLKHLDIDIGPVVRNEMRGISITCGLGDCFERVSDFPLVYGVRRVEFDHFLVEKAAAAGVDVMDGNAVKSFDRVNGHVVVRTAKADISGKLLIGADGANGVVRRALNGRDAFFEQVGLYCEVPREHIDDSQCDQRMLSIDWGSLPVGYAWAFPKSETVNVGVGAPVAFSRQLRRYLRDFLDARAMLKGIRPDSLKVSGHKLPSITSRTKLAEDRVLLIGDAAGLIDPFTGDGMSYGVHSGAVAEDVVMRWLGGEESALDEYEAMVRKEVVFEIEEGRRLMSFFHAFVEAIHDVFQRDDRAWRDLCGILRGESTFHDFHVNRLGALKMLRPSFDWVGKLYERTWSTAGSRDERALWLAGLQRAAGAVVRHL